MDNTKIAQILVEKAYISDKDLKDANEKVSSEEILDYFIENKIITQDLIDQAVAEYLGIKFFDLKTSKATLDDNLQFKIPNSFNFIYKFAILKEGTQKIEIIVSNPENIELITESLAGLYPNKKFNFLYVSDEDLEKYLTTLKKPLESRISEILQDQETGASSLVSAVIQEALEFKASDIHFEPLSESVRVRFRIDGMLKQAGSVPKKNYENVLNIIKILGRMRIDEHIAPQDGAIRVDSENGKIDLRISIIPVIDGEKMVIRILSVYLRGFGLEDLGLSKSDKRLLINSFSKKYGMILTAGPTGSGKTTTLYSILKVLNTPEANITTIEDPVEFRVEGINQIQVNPQAKVTFARGLRSVVRQDPNVILVGEIRDFETAEIAVNASLTGHLLLSTFHANDAATVIPRLIEMGIEPFLIASTINLIVAQRLARKICSSCKYSEEISSTELKKIHPEIAKFFDKKTVTLYKGKGCEKCNFSGYKGRIGIFQLIFVTSTLQNLILKNPSSKEIWELASSEGAKSFFQDGIDKVKHGLTSIEELLRIVPVEKSSKEIYSHEN